MFAIFQNRGKQYKAAVGSFLKLPVYSEKKKNDVLTFDEVVFIKNDKGESIVGSPLLKNVVVKGIVIDRIRDKKIIVFKKKRRKNYRRKMGHRQDLTLVKIQEINVSNSSGQNTLDKKVKKSEDKKVLTKDQKEDVNGS